MPSRLSAAGRPAPLFLILLFSPFFFTSSLYAQTPGGPGERAQGMGGAFVAVADDASAVYWNPAGLGNVWKFDAQLNLATERADSASPERRTGFAGAAIPSFGLAYYRLHTGVPAPADRKTEGTGKVHPVDLSTGNLGASFLQTIVRGLVVGVTPRLVSGPDRTTFDIDAGAMLSVLDVRVGVVGRNLRQPDFVTGDGAAVTLARQARVGVAYTPRYLPTGSYGPFSVAFDVDLTKSDAQRHAAAGSEQWWVGGRLGTRLGVQWNTIGDREPAISGGATVKLSTMAFAEGHVTKTRDSESSNWGAGLRITF